MCGEPLFSSVRARAVVLVPLHNNEELPLPILFFFASAGLRCDGRDKMPEFVEGGGKF